jgi:tryptophan halogenase
MISSIQHVVIVGGGTAGWLSACVLAAKRPDLSITLVESPDIPTIGVGEGTWPTMRETLSAIGISEADFLRECDGSFKQGSRFDGWTTGAPGDSYLHPFTMPPPGDMSGLLAAWQSGAKDRRFASAMTAQVAVCEHGLAPRQRTMPDFAGAVNYGYHLDAGKFAALLTSHGITKLGIKRIADIVTGVEAHSDGDISALQLRNNLPVSGDLFIDCSGHSALLIGGHFNIDWVDRSDTSFNDRALAVQVPVAPDSVIASQTIGTAHEAGWLWDIALPSRRGIGCVYSSRFLGDEAAERILTNYLVEQVPGIDPAAFLPRKLSFATGHRARFWHRNCLAIGMSAGFIEPLEASAIVMIELSLKALTENFPSGRQVMDIHAARFNDLFDYRWNRVVDFLKLHYILSQRQEPYWQAQRAPETIPTRLAEQVALWKDQPPSAWDFPQIDEIFSAASQQYILYGMGFPTPSSGATGSSITAARASLAEIHERGRALVSALPTNRTYMANIKGEAATLMAQGGTAQK